MALAKLARIFTRIYADADHLDASRPKIRQALLKTPQLGVAERSPVASVEDQHRPAVPSKDLRKRYRPPAGIGQREIGRPLAGV